MVESWLVTTADTIHSLQPNTDFRFLDPGVYRIYNLGFDINDSLAVSNLAGFNIDELRDTLSEAPRLFCGALNDTFTTLIVNESPVIEDLGDFELCMVKL